MQSKLCVPNNKLHFFTTLYIKIWLLFCDKWLVIKNDYGRVGDDKGFIKNVRSKPQKSLYRSKKPV